MRQQTQSNTLNELGYKIFLDRYALKDGTRASLTVGDVVVVVINEQSGQREIGKVVKIQLPKVTVELLDGEQVERDLEHVDKPLETHPDQMMDRVAWGVAQIEPDPEQQTRWQAHFRWLLDDWKFVPGGRILTAAGTDQNLTYYNCYVIESPKDSREGIIHTLGQMTEIMSRGGGVGINISTLRPRHAYVKGVNGRSSGSVSWGALYSFVTGLIEQGGCFSADTRILTDKGLIPASELADRMETGEAFFAHTHRGLRSITARFRNGSKPLYEVETTRGYRLKITEDHKVAVLMDGNITTMPLKYLQQGDEILLLLGQGIDGEYVSLKPLTYERSVMSTRLNTDVQLPAKLDEDLAYLLGYAYADGYVQMGKKVTWQAPKALKLATANAHPEIRDRLLKSVQTLFGIQPTLENGDGACQNIVIYSRMLIEWLRSNHLLKPKAAHVRVPEAIFRSPSSVMGAFIAGYFDADGCNRGGKGGFGIDSISRDMLGDLQQLLSLNGIVAHISCQERTGTWQDIYRLSVTGNGFKERFIQFVNAEKLAGATPGERDMYHTYPASVWTELGARAKYRQRIYDGVSERISHNQLAKIQARLLGGNEFDFAEAIQDTLNVLPDTIATIRPLDCAEVFDFEVDEVHLLSGAGIYTSNSRRGALMLILNDWHPDVFDFINSKRKAGQITNANISVGVSNQLMEAVKRDGDWQLVFPDTSDPDYDTVWSGDIDAWRAGGHKVIPYKIVKAREVWNAIIESAWASAEPGVWFRERSNDLSNSWYFNPLIATNPCGEQPLGAFSVCNLGAINLARFYDDDKHDVKWDDLRQATRYAIRFLDNVIDSTPYFFEENRRVQAEGERRVGLGTMGIAELMLRLRVRYGSDASVELIDRIYHLMAREAYLMSSEIAQEKGSFHPFDADRFLESGFMRQMDEDVRQAICENGIRNVTLLTQAPTGTTGTMVNTSTGIEPFFSWSYYRKSRLGLHEEKVPLVAEFYAHNPQATTLPEYFVTAMELSPQAHVRVQGAFQRWIDSAISKTCNVPNDYTVAQVAELYEYMYELGCKGGTIYRDGSRDEQVLMLKKEEPQKPEAEAPKPAEQVATPHRVYPRPGKLRGTTVNTVTPFGRAYITMNDDEHGNPFEVFITAPGKAGSDLQADAEGLGRMISLSLRTTAPSNRKPMLKLIIDQLRDIGGTRSVGFGANRISSLPDAVARALEENYFPSAVLEQLILPMSPEPSTTIVEPSHQLSGADLCPTCASVALVREEGCRKCLVCGYSEC